MIEEGIYESLDGKEFYDGRFLQLDKVTVEHGHHALVDNLSLTVFEDEVFVIIGKNGCGKTAVLNTMAGEQHRPHGSATAFNVNLFKDMRFLRKNLLAYSEQEPTLLGTLTPAENIAFMCKFLGIENHKEIVKQTLADF